MRSKTMQGKRPAKKRLMQEWQRQSASKVFLPGMKAVSEGARSKVAKTFFSSPYYLRKASAFRLAFNKNPKVLFQEWQNGVRGFILQVQGLKAREEINSKEMIELADAFFKAYLPNALTESVQGISAKASTDYLALYRVVLQRRLKLGIKLPEGSGITREEFEMFFRPVAEMLFASAKNPERFKEGITDIITCHTESHKKAYDSGYLLPRPGDLWHEGMPYGKYLLANNPYAKTQKRNFGPEELGRELAAVNDVHAAIAMSAAPQVGKICDNFVSRHGLPSGIALEAWRKTWPLAKLASIGKQLHG